MAEENRLNRPWMVAVWPGMGHVAVTAGYYLMAKLGMYQIAELEAKELFDIEHVEVKRGLLRTGRRPRSRFFAWRDPEGRRDIVVFIGEAQPPRGKYPFCRRIVEFAQELGAERVFTFAAMATAMPPVGDSRVFGAATDEANLDELRRLELEIVEDGHIGGLNGVLLGAAAEEDLHGVCLLGEMPHPLVQLPYPKASLAVLEVFATIAGIELDLSELAQQAEEMDEQFGALMEQVQEAFEVQPPSSMPEEEAVSREPEEERLRPEDERHIEHLFEQAAQDRSKAYELKRELDRLDVYREYEDRFLDLFKKST